jgi:hypothetical protein
LECISKIGANADRKGESRMKLKLAVSLLLTIFVSVSYGGKMGVPSDWETIDIVEYKGTTGQPLTVAWGDQPYDDLNGTGWCPLAVFQIKICNEERDICKWIDKAIPRDMFEYTYSFPKTGHWVSYIRVEQKCQLPYRDPLSESCIAHLGVDDKRDGYEYSEWTSSTDPTVASVEGEARGWKNFVWLAAPGPLSSLSASREHLKSYANKGD